MNHWRLIKMLGLLTALILGKGTGDDGGGSDDDTDLDDDDSGDAGGSDDDAGDDGSDSGTLTKKQVEALVKKRVRSAARKARQDMLAELGVDSVDDAKGTLDADRKRRESELDEVEKAKNAAAEAKKTADAAESRALRAELRSELQEALATATDEDGEPMPIRPDRLKLALQIAVPQAEGSDEDMEDAVADAVEFVMEQSPEWFGSSGGDTDDEDDDESDEDSDMTPAPRARKRSNRNKPKPKNRRARAKERAQQHRDRRKASPAAGLIPD